MKNFIKQLLLAFTALGSIFVATAEPQAIHLKKGQQHLAVFATLHVAKPGNGCHRPKSNQRNHAIDG